jgi:hypothetical protein
LSENKVTSKATWRAALREIAEAIVGKLGVIGNKERRKRMDGLADQGRNASGERGPHRKFVEHHRSTRSTRTAGGRGRRVRGALCNLSLAAQRSSARSTGGEALKRRAKQREQIERIHRFRVNKERRQHLHRQTDGHHLDMTHVTERCGSPQTLVCTKNRRSYKRECDQYREDIAALAALENQARRTKFDGDWLDKIRTARALADEWSPRA